MKNDERGSVVVEAAYIFPIVFFAIILLIYMGNAYYLRAQIDNYTTQAAVLGAERCADPLLQCMEQGRLNMDTPAEVYRYILPGYMDTVKDEIKQKLEDAIKDYNGSFFLGMVPTSINCICEYKGNIVEPTFSVETTYKIEYPIRMIFTENNVVLNLEAKTEVPVVDMGDFIGTIDMIEDYLDNTGAKDKFNDATGGIKAAINNLFGK